MQLITVRVEKPEAINFVLGQTHFIKSGGAIRCQAIRCQISLSPQATQVRQENQTEKGVGSRSLVPKDRLPTPFSGNRPARPTMRRASYC